AISEGQLDASIRDSLEKSQYPFIPLENAEIKLNGALAKFHREKYYEAKILMEEALQRYDQDAHRKAITYWLLGYNALAMEDLPQTYYNWSIARETFTDITKGKGVSITRPDVLNWYQERLVEINKLMAATCIQEVYAWLDVPEHGHLDDQTQDYYRKILASISQRKNHDAHQLIDSLMHLSELSNDLDQYREVLVFCGVAKYQLGSSEEAIKIFKNAIDRLPPNSHRQAVTYWLLGITQWRVPRLREEAILKLKDGIQLFKTLRLEADRKHNPVMMKWYDDKLVFMQEYLMARIKSMLSA
ncbi:MAG: hypothetical protein LWX83_17165, partial [Anaerolineae bacterium]|nr:hypothetical protein [Anaerolineae bacterium]